MNRGAILAAARFWREQGCATIPVRYMTKVPLVKWTPWINKLPPRPLTEFWFSKKWPCNIAVVLNDGICVLDFDDDDTYYQWALKMGRVADTHTVRSSRGYHAYLRLMDYEPKTYSMQNGEIKCNGIVVTAPSIHPNGHEYEVVNRAPIRGVAGIDDLGVDVIEEVRWYASKKVESKSNGTGTVDRIKNTINIGTWLSRYTDLVQQPDGSLIGLCPFHNDNKPSFQVWPDDGRCYCYSPRCRAHHKTDVIEAASIIMNVTMADAITILASEL